MDAAFRGALRAVLERDYDTAEELLGRAVQRDSGQVDAYLALARLYRERGEIGRAIRVHQNLLLRPDLEAAHRVEALSELARDFTLGGFAGRAIASYEEVLAHRPRDVRALAALVPLLADAGDSERVIAMLRRLARVEKRKLGDEDAALILRGARADREQGRLAAARKAVKRALRASPESVDAQVLLGELEAERGKDKAALAAWKAAVRLPGSHPPALYTRLEAAFAARGQPREVEGFLRSHLEERPDDSAARLALARHLAARGDVDMAVAELRSLLDGDPANFDARLALGRLLVSEHRETDAVKEFGELLEVLEQHRSEGGERSG